MNELKIFENEEFGKVRVVMVEDIPYFVGKDVAEVLGYTNPSKALLDHVEDEDKLNNESLLSLGQRGGWLINESGLYSLILSSKLPKAKEFKRWVVSDILPTIRKYGLYATEELLNNPDFTIQALKELKKEKEKRKSLEKTNQEQKQLIEELKPMANYVDKILNSHDTLATTQIAKDYGLTAHALNAILHIMKIQYKVNGQWVLYVSYQNKGYTESKTKQVKKNGEYVTCTYTVWTQKGRLFLYNMLKDYGVVPLSEKESKQS